MFCIIIFMFVSADAAHSTVCSIRVNEDLGEPQPLLLLPDNTRTHTFYLPDIKDYVNLNADEEIYLSCPGSSLVVNGTSIGLESKLATCVYRNIFRINDEIVSFNFITCASYPKHTARYTGGTCLNKHGEVEIGFEYSSKFITQITSCFDSFTQNVLYTEFNLTSRIEAYQVSFPRVSWTETGGFFSVGNNTVEALYTRALQRKTVNGILGLNESSTEYIHETDNYYLARGHLVAKTDFVYGSQQRLTFNYLNAAPQWQTFNAGNWYSLESDVRKFASIKNLDLVVFTGTYGITTLPDINGVHRGLFLYLDENNNSGIPVPQVLWKVLYDPIGKAGIAFVGVNNPYYFDADKDVFCNKHLCDEVNWLTWNKDDITKGYSYCCTVNDLRKTVTNLPQLEISKILM